MIDASEIDIEPGTKVREDDLPPELRKQLEDLRRMRRAMKGVNISILRLVTTICPPGMVTELGLDEFAESEQKRERGTEEGTTRDQGTTLDETISKLDEVERQSFWSRFV